MHRERYGYISIRPASGDSTASTYIHIYFIYMYIIYIYTVISFFMSYITSTRPSSYLLASLISRRPSRTLGISFRYLGGSRKFIYNGVRGRFAGHIFLKVLRSASLAPHLTASLGKQPRTEYRGRNGCLHFRLSRPVCLFDDITLVSSNVPTVPLNPCSTSSATLPPSRLKIKRFNFLYEVVVWLVLECPVSQTHPEK